MRYLIDLLIIAFLGYYMYNSSLEAQEYGYYIGQKDAIENQIKIQEDEDGCYYWIESPWKDQRETRVVLTKYCDK